MPARTKPLKRVPVAAKTPELAPKPAPKSARTSVPKSPAKSKQPADAPSQPAAQAWVRDPAKRLSLIADQLEASLGRPVWDGAKDGLEVLVLTVLSQNTTDLNALRGYTRLCEAFPRPGVVEALRDKHAIPRLADGSVDPVAIRLSQVADAFFAPDWANVMAAAPKVLEDVIRPAGLPNSKAPAIQRVLTWLHGLTGAFRLETALEGMSAEQAIDTLSSIKGIGLKTATVTMIEAWGADVCPVDTHVHRIIGLLGVVETNADRERTHRRLQPLIPNGKGFALHHNLLTLGRTVCLARGPKCEECPVKSLCATGRKV